VSRASSVRKGTSSETSCHVGQAVLALKGGLDYFLRTVFNYPTFAECYKVAAFNAANKLRFSRAAARTAPA
jgi:NAD(P) transhydrogenase